MWSTAVYTLHISPKLFYRLTPRQFDLLLQRHREELVHREMVAAFTTAAIVNHSFSPPDKPIPPSEWMPNFQAPVADAPISATPQQIEAKADFDGRVVQMTAEMKAYAESGTVGPALRALGYGNQDDPCPQQIGASK